MPYYKCTCCHHEFEYIPIFKNKNNPLCDWCGAPSYILEEKIPLEQLSDNMEEIIDEWKKKYLCKE